MQSPATNFSTTKYVPVEMKSLEEWGTTDGHCAERNVMKIWDACRLNGKTTNATFQQHAHPNISKKEETLLKML